MRKLFVAKDHEGKKIHIDSLHGMDSKDHEKFFCPYCSREVIPRFGEQKERHFAHKDGSCGVELNSKNKDDKDKNSGEIKLDSFKNNDHGAKADNTSRFKNAPDNGDRPDNPFYNRIITPKTLVRCRICGDNLRFENAVLIKENPGTNEGNIYICKNCRPRIKEIAKEL